MKSTSRSLVPDACAAVALAFFAGCTKPASEVTAFQLMKEADRYVGEQVKGKIVQVRSEKAFGGPPSMWNVVYYDPDATFKATEVKFGAGQKLEVTRPLRVLELVTGPDKLLDRTKLKVDSDRAIRIAASQPLLKPNKRFGTQLRLETGSEGPVWKVHLWVPKLRDSSELADVGEVIISAETAEVLRADLEMKNVD
jgi:hypothetical protein